MDVYLTFLLDVSAKYLLAQAERLRDLDPLLVSSIIVPMVSNIVPDAPQGWLQLDDTTEGYIPCIFERNMTTRLPNVRGSFYMQPVGDLTVIIDRMAVHLYRRGAHLDSTKRASPSEPYAVYCGGGVFMLENQIVWVRGEHLCQAEVHQDGDMIWCSDLIDVGGTRIYSNHRYILNLAFPEIRIEHGLGARRPWARNADFTPMRSVTVMKS